MKITKIYVTSIILNLEGAQYYIIRFSKFTFKTFKLLNMKDVQEQLMNKI